MGDLVLRVSMLVQRGAICSCWRPSRFSHAFSGSISLTIPDPAFYSPAVTARSESRCAASRIVVHLGAASEASAIASAERAIARMACLRTAESSGQVVTTSASSSRPSAIG